MARHIEVKVWELF
jgi:hypothetical protein